MRGAVRNVAIRETDVRNAAVETLRGHRLNLIERVAIMRGRDAGLGGRRYRQHARA